jgi:hypothetical protein
MTDRIIWICPKCGREVSSNYDLFKGCRKCRNEEEQRKKRNRRVKTIKLSQTELYLECNRGTDLLHQLNQLPPEIYNSISSSLWAAMDHIVARALQRGKTALQKNKTQWLQDWLQWAQQWKCSERKNKSSLAAWTESGWAAAWAGEVATWTQGETARDEAYAAELKLQAKDIRHKIPNWPGKQTKGNKMKVIDIVWVAGSNLAELTLEDGTKCSFEGMKQGDCAPMHKSSQTIAVRLYTVRNTDNGCLVSFSPQETTTGTYEEAYNYIVEAGFASHLMIQEMRGTRLIPNEEETQQNEQEEREEREEEIKTYENEYAQYLHKKLFAPYAPPAHYPIQEGKFPANHDGESFEVTVTHVDWSAK